MPYVPPHMRSSSGSQPSTSGAGDRDQGPSGRSGYSSRPDSSYGRPRESPRDSMGRNGSYSSLPKSASSNQMARAESYGKVTEAARPGASSGGRGPPETVFAPWQPSERVLQLTQEQIDEIKQRLNVTVDAGEGGTVPPPCEAFEAMGLHANILEDIKSHNYTSPTPIQAQGIPIALSGHDILGCAETGSGKTASFSIPMVHHCLQQKPLRPGDGPIGLVLAPTRELAQQIEREVRAFSTASRNVRSAIVVGGVSMNDQRHELRSGVEIVVATPGRFIDHLHQMNTNLDRVSFVVLDEADRMLDMGFEPQIKEVMNHLPARHQTLLFSATMPKEIEDLAHAYLTKPVVVKVGAVSTPTANVAQQLEHSQDGGKMELLVDLLAEEMHAAQGGGPPFPLTVVFVERKTKCDEVAEALRGEGIPAVALHGGLSQGERESALSSFAKGTVKVLVATDVASRGLDIKGIGHVVNMDLPKTFEDYVHRIGRTGRAGTKGRATSFWSERDSFLVSQIKTALAELERGNNFAFASGKEARQQERQLAQQFKTNMKLSSAGVVQTGSAAVKLDDKYSHMAKAVPATAAGVADAAWDD